MSAEYKDFDPSKLAIATTTLYPNYNIPNSSDRVRGDLALSLADRSVNNGFQLIVVDGGSTEDFIEKLTAMGVVAIPQQNGGMDESRFQAYKETARLPDADVIAWTEVEKAPLISSDLWEAAQLIHKGEVKVIVPSRSEEGFRSIPDYQQRSEKSANSILQTTLARHKIYAPLIDWTFGPKMFHKDLLPQFTNETSFWKKFRALLKVKKPRLAKSYGYCGPLILPVIYTLHLGLPVRSFEMRSYRHPESQTQIEIAQKEIFIRRRLEQLEDINLTVDFFCQYLQQR